MNTKSLFLILSSIILSSCMSTNYLSNNEPGTESIEIFIGDERKVFSTVYKSMQRIFPSDPIMDGNGETSRGYYVKWTSLGDVYGTAVRILPVEGKANNETVYGYYYEVLGKGLAVNGRAKDKELKNLVDSKLRSDFESLIVTDYFRTEYKIQR